MMAGALASWDCLAIESLAKMVGIPATAAIVGTDSDMEMAAKATRDSDKLGTGTTTMEDLGWGGSASTDKDDAL